MRAGVLSTCGAPWLALIVGLGLAGCASKSSDVGGQGADEETSASTETGDDDGSDPTVGDGDGDGDGDSDCGGSFYGAGLCDAPEGIATCDFWAEQDCQAGEKCQAVAATPGSEDLDANKCVPTGLDPVGAPCCVAGVGDCEMEGPAGTDSCDETSICMDVDPDTLLGTCVEYCVGPEDSPSCPQSGDQCGAFFDGVLNICVSDCDPTLPGSCDEGGLCIPLLDEGTPAGFTCWPATEGTLAGLGEDCQCANCCEAGLMCEQAALTGLDCAGDSSCTQLCDVNDADFTCSGPQQECLPLFDTMDPIYGHVGQCRLP